MLSLREQWDEIEGSLRACEALANDAIGFSYPYGLWVPSTADLVREAGFKYAVTTEANYLQARHGAHALPRLRVRNWTGEELGAALTNLAKRLPLT